MTTTSLTRSTDAGLVGSSAMRTGLGLSGYRPVRHLLPAGGAVRVHYGETRKPDSRQSFYGVCLGFQEPHYYVIPDLLIRTSPNESREIKKAVGVVSYAVPVLDLACAA
jgi:hypothetical protein